MATLAELYEYLETKRDDEHIDSVYSYSNFSPEEWPKARLEILAWWKVERLAEDKNCAIDKDFAIVYLDERANTTNNLLLKYRYNYFAHLLVTNDNRFAQRAIDALIGVIETLLPDDKEDYPHHAEDAIEILMSLVKSVKYKKKEATGLIWNILESDYGYCTKLVCIRAAKEQAFLPASDAERIVCLCKDLLPLAKDGWRESCCKLGLFFTSKFQGKAKPYITFFYEALGDMEMDQLKDPATEPNNIAIPLMNEGHLEKAMAFYQESGLIEKRNKAEQVFRENKKKVVIPHFKIEKRTNEQVVKYFEDLAKELLEGKLSWLLVNLSFPVRFLFPSYEQIRDRMPDRDTSILEILSQGDGNLELRKTDESESSADKGNIKAFGLKGLYAMHDDYVKEIIEKAAAYDKTARQLIADTFQKRGYSPDQVFDFVWGKYLDDAQYENRVLSKLTKDLLEQLEIKR